MARINIEDDLHARPEFKRLVRDLGNEDLAVGLLYRFWRVAQNYWGKGLLMPFEEAELDGYLPIVKVGLAEVRPEGVYALGSEKQFAWYLQRVRASSRGAETTKKRHSGLPERPKNAIPVGRNDSSDRPSSSSSSSSSNLKNIYTASEMEEAVESWRKTLARYGIDKKAEWDKETIARLIGRFGIEKTKLALLGAGFQSKSDKYDPAKQLRITWLQIPDKFELCVNLGAQHLQEEREWVSARDAI